MNNESIPNFIEYKNYPNSSLGFYSLKHDKIYITPLAKKYPRLHKHLIEHETKHYYYYKKPACLSLIYNISLEWIDLKDIFNWSLMNEKVKCEKEFNQINFSNEDIENFNKEFSLKKYSREWYTFLLYVNLRPDGYIIVSLVSYLFISSFNKILIYNCLFTIIITSWVYFNKNMFKIKNRLKNR